MDCSQIQHGEFTVLISVYYKEKPQYLNDCLKSIYSSTLNPAEVILVKDGPLSNELNDVIDFFVLNNRLKVICLEENKGLGIALNIGLHECNYKLVARMDADDICEPERFRKQYTHLIDNPYVNLLGGNITEYSEDFTSCQGLRTVPSSYDEIRNKCHLRNPFNHMTVMFRKEAILSVGGYKEHQFMEDYNLWLRLIASGNIVENLNESLVKVRAGHQMIKRRSGLSYIKSEYKLMKLINELKLTNRFESLAVFLMRSFIRCLPHNLLHKVYILLRH